MGLPARTYLAEFDYMVMMKRGHDLLPPEQHRRLGATLFNHVWDLMEKEGRTTEEDV